jgi:hypothetical protein
VHSRPSMIPVGIARVFRSAVPLLAMVTTSVYAEPPPPGLQPTEINVTRDSTHRWGEPEIAVNPRNPNNMVYAIVGVAFTNDCQAAAATDPNSPCKLVNTVFGPQPVGLMSDIPGFSMISAWVTFDGGRTWKRTLDVPGQRPVFPLGHPGPSSPGDPLVTAGPDGTFYLGWDAIVFANLPTTIVAQGGIAAVKSKDGGLTWSNPVLTGTTIDRPFFTSDLSTGVIYEASSGQVPGPLASGDPTTIPVGPVDRHLVSSTDGVHWSTPQAFGGVTGIVALAYMSAAHGQLATAFKTGAASNALCGSAPTPCTVFETTTATGATWSRHVVPAPSTYTGSPLVAADPSKPGHFAIALLMNSGAEFFLYQTNDSGNTWSGPATVSDDINKLHYHAWMAFSSPRRDDDDRDDHHPPSILGLMWKTAETAPGGNIFAPYNVWAAISRDAGATFSDPLKISSAPSPAPDARPFANGGDDFSFITFSKENALVGWADWRPGERSGFFSAIKLGAFKFKENHESEPEEEDDEHPWLK